MAFAAAPETEKTAPAVGDYPGLSLDGGDGQKAMAERWPDGIDLLVVDHYGLNRAFETACRPWARSILAIDDAPSRPHDCDMLLDQTWGRSPVEYQGLAPTGCRVLAGARYALLRPGFAALRDEALTRREVGEAVRRIQVSAGGTDAANATGAILDALERVGMTASYSIDIVLGAAAPNLDAIRERASRISSVRLHVGIEDPETLIAKADIAIGAAGSSAWERCCLGLPSVMVVVADNQSDIAEGLDRDGAAVNLGRLDDLGPDSLVDALQGLIRNGEARRRMSRAAARVCDGNGAWRVVREIEGMG